MSLLLRKWWFYIVPLAILFLIATCGEEAKKTPVVEDDFFQAEDTTSVSEDPLMEDMDTSVEENTIPGTEVDEPVQTTISDPQWRLVISSQPTRDRAERFIAKHNAGQAEIIYVEYLDTYRVVLGSFTNLREAQNNYDAVQRQFPEAWLVRF